MGKAVGFSVSFPQYPPKKKEKDKEKLGTKAVVEEFHAKRDSNDVVIAWKQLYGWSPLNTNIWLPSLSELIGYTGTEHINTGGYNAAMQGLNLSTYYYVDIQGSAQFAHFQQYNTSGGGQKIWNACGQEETWLRSVDLERITTVWRVTNATALNAPYVTNTHAVHPAVGCRLFFYSQRRLLLEWQLVRVLNSLLPLQT